MDYQLKEDNDKIRLKIKTLINNTEYEISMPKPPLENIKPILFYTATTDIRDFIANVTKISNGKCSIEGMYRGVICNFDNVIIKDKVIKLVGQRVMVTEHININGHIELIATTKRILCLEEAGLNFVNIGWSNKQESIYYRIDIYTGEYKEIRGESIR